MNEWSKKKLYILLCTTLLAHEAYADTCYFAICLMIDEDSLEVWFGMVGKLYG